LLGFVVSILKQICLLSGALYSEFAVILVVGYVLLPGAKTIIFKKGLPGNALGQVQKTELKRMVCSENAGSSESHPGSS